MNSFLAHTMEMVVFFIIGIAIKNAGAVDFAWPLGFSTVALMTLLGSHFNINSVILCSCYLFCGVRFMYGWYLRSKSGREDKRWEMWRENWKSGKRLLVPTRNIHANLLVFYLLQGWANALFFSVPLNLVAKASSISTGPGTPWSYLQTLGLVFYVFGFSFENVADYQLANFRQNKNNKGKVCDVGLWAYSRHPNYFGEWLIWLGYTIYSIPFLSGISVEMFQLLAVPLVALWFLVFLTGIPITEETSRKSRPGYAQYQKLTSSFFPLPRTVAKK